jgi:hypothetical protein
MNSLIFIWYLITGTIVPQKEVDDRMTYRVEFNTPTMITEGNQTFIGTTVDYAYKGEILDWIETNEFKYNEDI